MTQPLQRGADKSGVRGDAVVRKVLDAAREELAKAGYRAMRIEDVAARAQVHKTTVYRRWPTKSELVRDAMMAMVDEHHLTPDTGTLRGDLMEIGRNMTEFFSSMSGQSLFRMVMAESADPELADIIDTIRRSKESSGRVVYERAIERGELRPDVDPEVIGLTLIGSLHHRLFAMNQRVDELLLSRLVDLVLMGAAPRTPAPAPSKSRNRLLR